MGTFLLQFTPVCHLIAACFDSIELLRFMVNSHTMLVLAICFSVAAVLPKDDGEFYQFCYVTSKGHVRGLSSPFQFRKSVSFSSSLSDLVEIEDENGELLIIKSKTAYLDEQLKKATEKCSMLTQVQYNFFVILYS
jgi:SKICH domain